MAGLAVFGLLPRLGTQPAGQVEKQLAEFAELAGRRAPTVDQVVVPAALAFDDPLPAVHAVERARGRQVPEVGALQGLSQALPVLGGQALQRAGERLAGFGPAPARELAAASVAPSPSADTRITTGWARLLSQSSR